MSPNLAKCRICESEVEQFLDLGRQPLSDAFRRPEDASEEFFYHLAVGCCAKCSMVQLMEEVPRERMFHEDYPFHSSGSAVMREHFAATARNFLATELTGDNPFIVEIGCNDGIMLRTIGEAGVRHLGFEPSGGVAKLAATQGVRIRNEFFEASTARAVLADEGPADVIFAANTLCHIPYMASVLTGVDALLAPNGVFVFEDPYWGDIVAKTSFDQIYDEHFYLFTATSVAAMAELNGLELVDVERLTVHGGEIRYTLARMGARTPSPAVAALLADEATARLSEPDTLHGFASSVDKIKHDLVELLTSLRSSGHSVAAYGATAKSATVTNLCGIGPDLVSSVYDNTPAKQHRLTPGAHLPVVPTTEFTSPYPDYAVLFAWNHAKEIMAKERGFRDAGGKWVLYVPDVRVV